MFGVIPFGIREFCPGFESPNMCRYIVYSFFLFPSNFIYWRYLSSHISPCLILCLIILRQVGQKLLAFGIVGDSVIHLPVCHNSGMTKCELMHVYLASHCLPRPETCQPMSVGLKRVSAKYFFLISITEIKI